LIDATHDVCVAYKPNTAFYESLGESGWMTLHETKKHIPNDNFSIADAKRGDIGNTSKMYAKAFLENMEFDAITIAPYMGKDSVEPFLSFENKWAILLALTSNEGSIDFQKTENIENLKLYEDVLIKSQKWGNENNMMYVVGATRAEDIASIRKIIPNHFLLVPGVGAQGGSLKDVCRNGLNKDIGLLINSSRGIIYASKEKDFAQYCSKRSA
jgi:orotidine-5'-phosphate decarboxylase